MRLLSGTFVLDLYLFRICEIFKHNFIIFTCYFLCTPQWGSATILVNTDCGRDWCFLSRMTNSYLMESYSKEGTLDLIQPTQYRIYWSIFHRWSSSLCLKVGYWVWNKTACSTSGKKLSWMSSLKFLPYNFNPFILTLPSGVTGNTSTHLVKQPLRFKGDRLGSVAF